MTTTSSELRGGVMAEVSKAGTVARMSSSGVTRCSPEAWIAARCSPARRWVRQWVWGRVKGGGRTAGAAGDVAAGLPELAADGAADRAHAHHDVAHHEEIPG